MLGDDACERLRESFAVIVGLGAVGGYAVEGLARAGVGRLRLIDFDKVAPSNINRQLLALGSTVGRPKCEVARERILDINPDCSVEIIQSFADADTIPGFLADSPDIVIDAIDALNSKVELIVVARSMGLPIISCLGAALRFDPTAVRVGPLSDVHHCPLGKTVRVRLRRRGVPLDFPCIYSDEPLPKPLPLAPPSDDLADPHIIQRGRARNTLGSLPTVTGMFGLTAANHAIKILIGREKGI